MYAVRVSVLSSMCLCEKESLNLFFILLLRGAVLPPALDVFRCFFISMVIFQIRLVFQRKTKAMKLKQTNKQLYEAQNKAKKKN